MAVRVIDSLGRRIGLPGKRANIYTLNSRGGMLLDNAPLGLVVYRSTTQSIPAGNPTSVSFDTAVFPPASYGMPAMWTSGANVSILESDWYFLSASVQCAALTTGANIYVRFRFGFASGLIIPGDSTYVPNQYSLPISSGIPYYLNAGDTLFLQLSHTHTSALTLNAGITGSGLKISRLPG